MNICKGGFCFSIMSSRADGGCAAIPDLTGRPGHNNLLIVDSHAALNFYGTKQSPLGRD